MTLSSLHHPDPPYTGGTAADFSLFEGQVRWVGPPSQFVESTSNPQVFYSAGLQCTPHFMDWSTVGLLHVTGPAMVPSSLYEVKAILNGCDNAIESSFSLPLTLATTRWGDVETPFNPPDLSTQPDVGDISALVSKFRSVDGAPIKARALLAGSDASGNIDISTDLSFSHISACVEAFRGAPYPHAGPESCN